MVFQRPNPFPKSIYENVAYGVRLHHQPACEELDAIVEKSLRSAAIWKEVAERLRPWGVCQAVSSNACASLERLPLSPISS